MNKFEQIRLWAKERNLYEKGDTKTQTLKLIEEAGELSKGVLKNNKEDIIDGIGDCVVVLTNLSAMYGFKIEDCIEAAWQEIKSRKGKMINGTFVKE